ncbi:RNA polymerase sigma factor [Massilia sp. erpn]|uniref:RNA polymerase sigma factor n=1 Tax=Massilia sp. erpn TaxID=2738142 RepID=UPI002106D856|nr:sigma-70 family RNA polymerase sigma factor [Massilia sp. erpn]UTY59251.1 sigma-70 family RNA polymerase sigma factor [Massilia sp. erpn]
MAHEQGRLPAAGSQARLDADEIALLREIVAGDRRAFETLYRLYFPRLIRFLGRICRNPALVEEAANDTFLVVWRKAASYDGSCKVSTWIFGIAWRKVLKALKLDGMAPAESTESADCCDETTPTPERQAEAHELSRRIDAALCQLPLAQRLVVVLTYFHGLGYGEIAGIAGCPANTVKTRMFHARHRLKSLLADVQEEAP